MSMHRPFMQALVFGAALLQSSLALSQATPGEPAPSFELVDVAGKRVSLANFRGRYVVLEWTNPSCPFVQKHYGSGNMQSLQKRYAADNVAWLTINSTAASHSEYLKPDEQAAWIKQQGASSTAVMLDPEGRVGRAYGARATPHMYVIDPAGKLIYAGAIDDKRSANPADVKTANNYVVQALNEARASKPVSKALTPAYGCSIKYSD
jgi:peroxiredoxin